MQNSLILYSTMFSFFFRNFFLSSLNLLVVVVETEFICMDDWVSSFSHHCVFINMYGTPIWSSRIYTRSYNLYNDMHMEEIVG